MFDINSARVRKFDKAVENKTPQDFIPIACHYNENTLLTKKGELIQIIQINGINSEKISEKLFNLREIIRTSIQKNVKSSNFAFWIHTIRQKTNLDDQAPYNKLLPASIHHLWQAKNYWHDKFVNTLYISIIHSSTEIKIKNLGALIKSLSSTAIKDFENTYLERAFLNLNHLVDNVLIDLQEFGAVKLGIVYEDDKPFSEPLFLYNRLLHLDEENVLLPTADLSETLVYASNNYAIGGDKIEVSYKEEKHFIAILGIKEYPELSSSALDSLLQLPLELIITEIFYFTSKSEVMPIFKDQGYILKVSNDSELAEIKGLNKMDEVTNGSTTQFCDQQISITIIGKDIDKLTEYTTKTSNELAKLGIVHVKEDMHLEQIFWSQLPGNFTFIRRTSPVLLEHIAALASLHNFPTGNQYNIWGKAVTILRTEKGTPYFMNFHNKFNQGNTCVFGTAKSGKTILTNFLISEATKYNPTIVYLSNQNDSKIFIEAIEGTWIEKEQEIINPFLLEDNQASRDFINEFLKIISNHYISPLSENEIVFLKNLTSKIFTTNIANRNFSLILKETDFSIEGGESIKKRLAGFVEEDGLYKTLFDGNKIPFSEGGVIGVNLANFTEESFSKKFYPTERKYLEQFTINLGHHNSISAALIYAFNYHLTISGNLPKILAIDNLDVICKPENFFEIMRNVSEGLEKNNGIILSNFNFGYLRSAAAHSLQKWLELINTKIILPSDIKPEHLDKILGLNKAEIAKLAKLKLSSRMFLINQDNESIAAELSIASLVGIIRILSSKSEEFAIYQNIIKERPGHPDDWLNPLYDALNILH